MKLSRTEEKLMDLIWRNERVLLKDLIDSYPEPKPAPSTIATFLKRMQDKGFVGYELYGNSRQYYPLVNKDEYFSKQVKGIIKNYFSNSALQFASFFTTTGNLTEKELEELKKIIDEEIKKNRQ
jgi:BlaI family transcriptional regulator, penicillinase repressor